MGVGIITSNPGELPSIPDLQGLSSSPFPCVSRLLCPPVQCSSKEASSQRQKPSWAESSDPRAPSLRDPPPQMEVVLPCRPQCFVLAVYIA